MWWRNAVCLGAAIQLVPQAFCYGTTVLTVPSYCPAPPVTPVNFGGYTSLTPGSSAPFFLSVVPDESKKRDFATQWEYLADDGAITMDPINALVCTITPTGQLMAGTRFFSTSGLMAHQIFKPHSSLAGVAVSFTILDSRLIWMSDSFAGQHALFCLFGSILEAVFNSEPPPGCILVTLGAIPTSSITISTGLGSMATIPGSQTSQPAFAGSLTTSPTPSPSSPGNIRTSQGSADPVGCLNSAASSFALTGATETVSTLEQCLDFCAVYTYFGVQYGNQCVCGNTLGLGASPVSYGSCNIGCSGSAMDNCGGAKAMVVYTIVSRSRKSPKSSMPVPLSSISPVTTTSTLQYPSPTTTGSPNCYDRSPFDGTVNGGYLILCDTQLPGFDLGTTDGASLMDCIAACNSYPPQQSSGHCVAVEYDITATSGACRIKSDVGTVNRGENQFAQAAIIVNEPYAPSIVFSSQSSAPSTLSPNVPLTSPSTAGTNPAQQLSSPVVQSSLRSSSTSALPSSSVPSTVGPSSSTVQSITSASSVPPGLPPVSIPASSSSMGQPVLPLTTSTTPPPSSKLDSSNTPVVQLSSTPSVLSASTPVAQRSSTSPVVVTSAPAIQISTQASTVPSTSTKPSSNVTELNSSIEVHTSSGSAAPSCAASPPPGSALCPLCNRNQVFVAGSNYEVECSATLVGTTLSPANSTTSLYNCLVLCNLYNLALPYHCLGVNYYKFLGQNSCIFLSAITGTTYTPGVVDSGRLIYAGYSAITDPDYLTSSTSMSLAVSSTSPMTSTQPPISSPPASNSTKPASSTQAPAISSVVESPAITSLPKSSSSTAASSTTTPLSSTCAPIAPSNQCPGISGQCFTFSRYGTAENYETECGTQLVGTTLQPYAVFDFQDCISFCQYDNVNKAATCVGVTFLEGPLQNPPINNCFPYGTITLVTHSNSSYDSARLIYGGYPAVTDYGSATPNPP